MTEFLRNSTYKVSLKKTLGGWKKFRLMTVLTPSLPMLGPLFQGFFSRIYLINGWQVYILGILSAKCFYLLKHCFNYIFQVSISYISRKVMERNNKLKSTKWKVLHKKKDLKFGPKKLFLNISDWNFKKLMSYLKLTPSNLSKYQKIEQNNNDNSSNKK